MSVIYRIDTHVGIGNQGVPLACVNDRNESLIRRALNEFTEGLFDSRGVQRYFKVRNCPVVMDSLKISNNAIWASVRCPRIENDDPINDIDDEMRRGCLWLGADIEFEDEKPPLSTSTLTEDMAFIKAQSVSEGMTSIKFVMFYYWEAHHNWRHTIYKTGY